MFKTFVVCLHYVNVRKGCRLRAYIGFGMASVCPTWATSKPAWDLLNEHEWDGERLYQRFLLPAVEDKPLLWESELKAESWRDAF